MLNDILTNESDISDIVHNDLNQVILRATLASASPPSSETNEDVNYKYWDYAITSGISVPLTVAYLT